jgi:hypothetical protein
MKRSELAKLYFDAWNRRDAAAVLELFHPGAAVYDALWRESCVGSFLAQYIHESLDEDEHWYELSDELIYCQEGVICRYTAHEWDGTQVGEKRFEGAEVLTVHDGKILTSSDYYYDPDPKVLEEVAKLSALRHGVPAYVSGGHGAYKQVHVKQRLLEMLSGDAGAIAAELTVAGLAEKIGCSVEHLLGLAEEDFGADIEEYIGHETTKYAAELLSS